MKTFVEFILEAQYYNLLIEGPKPPDYNYEEAFVRLYNYLVGSEDRKNRVGKQMRGLLLRTRLGEDSPEQAGIMDDIVSLIAREVSKAEKDPNHPLHFNNIPDVGFNRGGKTPEHQTAYYEKLNGQKYTFLNFIRSKSGRAMGAQRLLAVRAGSEKTPLSPRGEKVYGKSSDTSKADVLFKDSSGEVLHTSSLKDSGGSVYASSGPEETKGNLLMGMYASLDSRLEKKEINQNEYDELVERGTQLASEIALKMTTKGLSKEEEKKIIDPEIDSRGLFKTMGDFEDSFPGVSEYVAKEQITGKGKYGRGVDSVMITNKGGELIEFPEFLSTFVKHRFRTSKHGVQGNTSQAADAQKVDPDVERPGPDREAYSKLTKSNSEKNLEARIAKLEPEIQDEIRKLQGTGQFSWSHLYDYEQQDTQVKQLKSFDQFQKDTQLAQADLEQQVAQTQQDLEAANASAQDASVPINPETGEPILRQYRKNIEVHMAADPTSPTAQVNNQRRQQAQNNLAAAQSNFDNASTNYQATVSASQQQQSTQQPNKSTEPSQDTEVSPTSSQLQQPQPTEMSPPEENQQLPPQQEKPKENNNKKRKKPEQSITQSERSADQRARMDVYGRSQGLPEYA